MLLGACTTIPTSAVTETATNASSASSNNSQPPSGAPPSGTPGANPSGVPGGNAPGGSTSSVTLSGAYTVNGQTVTETGKTYAAGGTDQSSVYVENGGNLTLDQATVTSSSASSSSDNSSFYGLNAGVLVGAGSSLTITHSTVVTKGDGANGVFATGTGANISISDSSITVMGQYAHGIMATQGGTITANNVDMSTAGASSGAIATDRGGGIINIVGGMIATTGANSPGIYSTGDITVDSAEISASGSEAAVIEGANSISLIDTTLTTTFDNKWGVMIYQSMSGDAAGTEGTFTMSGGTLEDTAQNGPLFYVTNSTGVIQLEQVAMTTGSGILIKAAAGNWGTSGGNGGTVYLTADKQTMSGDIVADNISSVSVILQNNSVWTGAINADKTANQASISLDGTSQWIVTADSYLTGFSDDAGISGTTVTNIIGNGHTVYYNASANTVLGGQTYSLSGGGTLTPMN